MYRLEMGVDLSCCFEDIGCSDNVSNIGLYGHSKGGRHKALRPQMKDNLRTHRAKYREDGVEIVKIPFRQVDGVNNFLQVHNISV